MQTKKQSIATWSDVERLLVFFRFFPLNIYSFPQENVPSLDFNLKHFTLEALVKHYFLLFCIAHCKAAHFNNITDVLIVLLQVSFKLAAHLKLLLLYVWELF